MNDKTTRNSLIVGVIFLLALLVGITFWVTGQGERTAVNHYSMTQLTDGSIPNWNPTNAIPLSPDQAVNAAIGFVNAKRGKISQWDVDRIGLSRYAKTPWFYTVTLVDRQTGEFEMEIVRILMNGEVWKPETADGK